MSTLNAAIGALDPAKISNFPPAKVVFRSVTALLTLIRVCFMLSCNDLLRVHTQLGLCGE